jgi:hypothetical protein
LAAAETAVLPQIGRYDQANADLVDFEDRFGAAERLVGRLWRVRVLANAGSGRLDELPKAIAKYISVEPAGAGHTLQALLDTINARVETPSPAGGQDPTPANAAMAVAVAEALHRWADSQPAVSQTQRKIIAVQLAEARLRAGQFQEAKRILTSWLPEDGSKAARDAADIRILLAHAQAQMSLGEHASALRDFNLLATSLPPISPGRWEALIGDLTCRTALNETPDGIIRVIQQQRLLYPDLGGPKFAPRLEQLLRENERRAAQP